MRPDLLEAKASVDWAVSKLPRFQRSLRTWLDRNVEIVIEETPSPALDDLIVVVEKVPLPLRFVVEAGAYVNAIRSSLDILASAIGKRETALCPDKHYFPVAASAQDFATGNYKGFELVRQLPRNYRDIIESFQPYYGGNENIWVCHDLDITRKHKRLLEVTTIPVHYGVSGFGLKDSFDFIRHEKRGEGKTAIAKLRKGAEHPDTYVTHEITLAQPEIMRRRKIVPVLRQFADTARRVIKAFDIA